MSTLKSTLKSTITMIRHAALALLLAFPTLAAAQGASGAAGETTQRQRLSQDQREELRKRWQAMAPEERQKILDERKAERSARLAAMTPEDRAKTEARQQALRDRWAKMSPDERDALRKRAEERRTQRSGNPVN